MIGSDYLRDERQRLSDLVSQVELRTERRYRDGSETGQAAVAESDALTHPIRYEGGDIRTATGTIHRRFQVRSRPGDAITWPSQNGPGYVDQAIVAGFVLRVGYEVGGGSRIDGTPEQIDDVAAEDVEIVRQQIWHWSNFNTPSGNGITSGRCELVEFGTASFTEDPERRRVIWELPITSHLIVETQPPQTFTRAP